MTNPLRQDRGLPSAPPSQAGHHQLQQSQFSSPVHHHHHHSHHHPSVIPEHHSQSVPAQSSMLQSAPLHSQPGQPPGHPTLSNSSSVYPGPSPASMHDPPMHAPLQHIPQHHQAPYPNPNPPQLAQLAQGPMETDPNALLASGVPQSGSAYGSAVPFQRSTVPILSDLEKSNESTWLVIGAIAEQMLDLDLAIKAYQRALRHNPESKNALAQIGGIARTKEEFPMAIEYISRVLTLDQQNGELWSALGHCYLMLDALPKAYSAYQQALYCLQNPSNVKLWYGIGILYDRYGSLEHAEEAFTSVLRMEDGLSFEKTSEVFFRLGVIYKQQHRYDDSLACFEKITDSPPGPLHSHDIWFQIGHVYEQKSDWDAAKTSYERALHEQPQHAKVLQQLGWLYFQTDTSFHNVDSAIECLTRSLGVGGLSDESDAQSWYLLGRAYMAAEKYNKAYEAYQQAVYRDGRNPTFWCSIGVLYYQIQQFRDALDAYSRAIRINPYIAEVWYDLGCLYESCNNQVSDAIDAYKRALELDTENQLIKERLRILEEHKVNGGPAPPPPPVQDVHPTAYASSQGQLGPPTSLGPPFSLGLPSPRGPFVPRPEYHSHFVRTLPQQPLNSPGLTSVITYEQSLQRRGHEVVGGVAHQQIYPEHRAGPALAPMDIERRGPDFVPNTSFPGSAQAQPAYARDSLSAGELHSVQQAQIQHPSSALLPPRMTTYDPLRENPAISMPPQMMQQYMDERRNIAAEERERLAREGRPLQSHKGVAHAPQARPSHHALLNPATPPQSLGHPPHADARAWESRGPPSAQGHHPSYGYPPRETVSPNDRQRAMYRSPPPRHDVLSGSRRREATGSPAVAQQPSAHAWDERYVAPPIGPSAPGQPPHGTIQPPIQIKRYDPRFDTDDSPTRRGEPQSDRMDIDRTQVPESSARAMKSEHLSTTEDSSRRTSNSPMPAKERKRKAKDKDTDVESLRKEKRPRKSSKKTKEDAAGASGPIRFKPSMKESPDSSRSRRASTHASPAPPADIAPSSRIVNEDYDEGVASEALIHLSSYRPPQQGTPSNRASIFGPAIPNHPTQFPSQAAPSLQPATDAATLSSPTLKADPVPPAQTTSATSVPSLPAFGPPPPPRLGVDLQVPPLVQNVSPPMIAPVPTPTPAPPLPAPAPVSFGPPRPPEMMVPEAQTSQPIPPSPPAALRPPTSSVRSSPPAVARPPTPPRITSPPSAPIQANIAGRPKAEEDTSMDIETAPSGSASTGASSPPSVVAPQETTSAIAAMTGPATEAVAPVPAQQLSETSSVITVSHEATSSEKSSSMDTGD